MNKKECLLKLAKKRQKDRYRHREFKNLCEYHNKYYECNYVSPYTISAHNVDSKIMIILKDWTSDDVLRKPIDKSRKNIGHDLTRSTNKNLKKYLKRYFNLNLEDTYATNLFPFIKEGKPNSNIDRKALYYAAEEYALPQIKCIKPCLVIALGPATFNAIRLTCNKNYSWTSGHKLMKNNNQHFEYTFYSQNPRNAYHTEIWFQFHTSSQAQNPRGVDRIKKDWQEMKEWFEKNCC